MDTSQPGPERPPERSAGVGDGDGDACDPGHDVVFHLQAAALEVIAAVRAFLDAAEGVVRDPAAAVTLASSLAARARPGHHGGGGPDGQDSPDGSGGVQRIPVT